jgi:NAD(P)-dependent dehydrogenase (short-subunit alcohol dehydrogenase family)
VDLTDVESVGAVVAEVRQRFGRIDVLVNAAGGYRAGTPVHETPLETWDFVLDLNARTGFISSSAVIPVMLEQGSGKIVNVSARAGLKGTGKAAAYSVSKSAVIRLTESMSAELKRSGINVNCILPGTIDTPQNRESMPTADHSRWVPPEALADVILFLASDAARAVHGAAVPVYGLS